MTDLHTSADRDVERAIRSWLQEDRHEDVSRVAGAVLDQVDVTQQRRSVWWSGRATPAVNRAFGFALAAIAVVAILVVGAQWFGRPAPGGVGGPPTATPEPRAMPSAGSLEPGTYRIADAAFTPVDLVVTMPAGWVNSSFGVLAKHARTPMEVGLAPDVVTHVYGDACNAEGEGAAVGPAVDDLVAALLAQQNVDVTGPTSVTIGGYPAQRLDLAPPPGLDLGACSEAQPVIRIWSNQPANIVFMLAAGHSASVYVADVDGQRVVIATDTGPEATDADIAERDAIVDAIRIEP
jgi:hypothetical protein